MRVGESWHLNSHSQAQRSTPGHQTPSPPPLVLWDGTYSRDKRLYRHSQGSKSKIEDPNALMDKPRM